MPDLKDFISVISLLIAAAALWRNLKGDSRSDGARLSEILVKMELVQSDLKEIKADFKAEIKGLKVDIEKVKERLVVVEQSAKSAHHRIDSIRDHKEDEHETD